MRNTLLTLALSVAMAAPAMAQQLKLDFQSGLVSVDATAVPVRTILTEWGKVGGTKIVGAERVTGAPLTLKLVNVSEAKALETILRSVAGYMAAPRNAMGAGPSMYDRILVMATSSAPAPAATRPTPQQPNGAFNGTQRFVPPRQRAEVQEQPEQDEPEERDENPPNPPVFTFPAQGQNGFPGGQPAQFNGAPGQTGMINNPNSAPPQGITINPAPAPGQSMPGMPVGASTPGMVVQPPQPGQRPPGRQQ
ncbi:MAG TPA: hypothetical protein VNT81_03855 [Vicinamibacterales bacterium]|nr:hypothetical protein [Vicinamibacterales bacterium]